MIEELSENPIVERTHKSSDTSVHSRDSGIDRVHKSSDTSVHSHDSGQFSSSSANSKRTKRTTKFESIGYKLQETFFKNTR